MSDAVKSDLMAQNSSQRGVEPQGGLARGILPYDEMVEIETGDLPARFTTAVVCDGKHSRLHPTRGGIPEDPNDPTSVSAAAAAVEAHVNALQSYPSGSYGIALPNQSANHVCSFGADVDVSARDSYRAKQLSHLSDEVGAYGRVVGDMTDAKRQERREELLGGLERWETTMERNYEDICQCNVSKSVKDGRIVSSVSALSLKDDLGIVDVDEFELQTREMWQRDFSDPTSDEVTFEPQIEKGISCATTCAIQHGTADASDYNQLTIKKDETESGGLARFFK